MPNTINWEIHPVAHFAQLAAAWDTLNDLGFSSALLESRFESALLKYFAAGNEIIAVAKSNEQTIAMGIFHPSGKGSWQTFQPSQAPLGAWVALNDLDTNAVIRSLMPQLPGLCFVIGLTQQDPDLMLRPENSGNVQTLDYIETGRITVNGSFDDYWETRGRNLRQNLKRQRNKLEREGIKTQLTCVTRVEDIEALIADYASLESAGWKNSEGTAVSTDNDQGRFYNEILKTYCETNDTYAYRYFYNEKLVAMDLCLRRKGEIIIIKTSYDESEKTSSPALLMRQESFREIIDDLHLQKIEFYGKVMEWHRRWTEEIRRMYHTNYFRSPIIKLVKKLLR